MSRHENADIIRRGYQDQKAGTVDPVLAEESSTRGELYRTGLRERRREEADSIELALRNVGAELAPMERAVILARPVQPVNPTYTPATFPAYDVQGKPDGPGGAFSEPVPGARKPRKAKPGDDAQASLF